MYKGWADLFYITIHNEITNEITEILYLVLALSTKQDTDPKFGFAVNLSS